MLQFARDRLREGHSQYAVATQIGIRWSLDSVDAARAVRIATDQPDLPEGFRLLRMVRGARDFAGHMLGNKLALVIIAMFIGFTGMCVYALAQGEDVPEPERSVVELTPPVMTEREISDCTDSKGVLRMATSTGTSRIRC